MKLDLSQSRIQSFRQRFGDRHFYLACHAALPLALTPDLLYCLWANFQRDIHGEALNIPWIAVSDLLLSGLCEEVGQELYELEAEIRNELLHQLKDNPRFGPERLRELTDFVLAYVEQQLYSPDLDARDFAEAQKWVALAYTNPAEAAHAIATVFAQLPTTDSTEWIRLEALMQILEQPLADFQPLLIYADAMAELARGNLPEATTKIRKALDRNNEIHVAQVHLPVPEALKKALSPQASDNIPLMPFEFDVITINVWGEEIQLRRQQAQFFAEDLGGGVNLEMVAIPGGTFQMGSPATEKERSASEGPRHSVTVKPFFMAKYEVTQTQWRTVAALPKVERDLAPSPSGFKGGNRPVEQVSWQHAVEFCARLSRWTRRDYRLPSEAEWEYACRAGTTTPFYFGETITTDLVNYGGSYTYGWGPKEKDRQQTTDVGNFPPNAFGLYDMHGNVWEWCLDHWHDNYEGAPIDGSAWIDSNDYQGVPIDSSAWIIDSNDRGSRVLRGGSWLYAPRYCRSAYRVSSSPTFRLFNLGFRVVCSAPRILS